jgi:hypothetical protein
MALINTIHGLLDEHDLDYHFSASDKPTEIVIVREWYRGQELVRRDAHVILKEASVTADLLAGRI